ncbi:MAG: hypothetical protein QXW26_04715 [Candidatus Nitrosocaldus sp.]
MDAIAEHYVHAVKYDDVYSKAVGYYDDPPLRYPIRRIINEHQHADLIYKPIGAPQSLLELVQRLLGLWKFDGTPFQYSATEYPYLAEGVTRTFSVAAQTGGQGVFVPGLVPSRIFTTQLPIRLVTILADDNNIGNIWVGYNQAIATGNAFKLVAGSARDFAIDDLSKIWLVAENTTDRVFYIYEV